MIRVLVNGANGKMGKTTVNAIAQEKDLQLIATASRNDNLRDLLQKHKPDVVVDFTIPQCVFENTQTIISEGVRPVIGTTGLTNEQIATLKNECDRLSLGAIIAPNFSLGAILMMKFAKDAAKYLPDVEIIEMHHPQKIDAPSGTALKTAHLIAEAKGSTPRKDEAKNSPARSIPYEGVTIHSVRLPGIFARQSVIFGGNGETLTLTHDASDRNAMMPGVFLACRKVMQLNHLIYGLEHLL